MSSAEIGDLSMVFLQSVMGWESTTASPSMSSRKHGLSIMIIFAGQQAP